MKKINIKAILMLCALFVPQAISAQDLNRIERLDTLIVCRSKQCKSANAIMTKEFLYNKLASLLKKNVNQKVLLCDADPNTHTCLNDGIVFDAMVGATPAEVSLPSMYIVDAKMMNDLTTENFISDYEFKVADTYPECQSALNGMTVNSVDEIFIESVKFDCHFTAKGTTSVNATYDIDYVDLDYGIVGATYTLGLSEASQGGAVGYALLHFPKNAHDDDLPVNCGCICNEAQTPPCQCKNQENQETVKKKTTSETVQNSKKEKSETTTSQAQSGQQTVKVKNDSSSTQKETVIVKEKVVTQYQVPPIEVVVRTKAVSFDEMPNVKVNGVPVKTKPVTNSTSSSSSSAKPQILDPKVPVVMEVEEL